MKFTGGFLICLLAFVCSCNNSGSFYEPAGNWTSLDYNDASWKREKAAFGTSDMPFLSSLW